jgi:hypothetical protein
MKLTNTHPLATAIATLLLSGLVMPGKVNAATITATVTGSPTPATETFPDTVTNGDFLITGNGVITPLIGDAADESTTWTFDFTKDPNFSSFSTLEPLTSALLTLTLTPSVGVITDSFLFGNLYPDIVGPIHSLPPDQTSTFTINVLDYFSSNKILAVLTSNQLGKIPMAYQEDAIVSFAKLELSNGASSASVPEPNSGLGILAFAVLSKCFLLNKRLKIGLGDRTEADKVTL